MKCIGCGVECEDHYCETCEPSPTKFWAIIGTDEEILKKKEECIVLFEFEFEEEKEAFLHGLAIGSQYSGAFISNCRDSAVEVVQEMVDERGQDQG